MGKAVLPSFLQPKPNKMMVKPALQNTLTEKNPSLEAYQSFFDSPIVLERKIVSHPIDGFLAPI